MLVSSECSMSFSYLMEDYFRCFIDFKSEKMVGNWSFD